MWPQAITTPMLWSGNMIAKTLFECGKPGFKNFTSVDNLTLVRSPCSQPASQRPTLEILFRLCGGNFRNITFDAHLPPKLGPVKEQARARVAAQLFAFATVIVCIKDETAIVKSL